ncbi:hypothetical protein D3870_01750 [Noviherbaspirillum cavernae]|uniref:STAS domain-containing protein n=1 Tax=Noviherbaspirillum cavernae TaxID=2320862 RepID=A0A418X5J8_9BURK|nr:hypothetical protein [Noviherbaspirillum cavernae]RJG07763.1 hypothetical protein D3870_01750 [Noviherbaspirillum cavernae]
MGIFSLFAKKDRRQTSSAGTDSTRARRDGTSSRSSDRTSSERAQGLKRDAHAARATALKIDAIESEMSSEFVKPATVQPLKSATPPRPVPVSATTEKKILPPLDFTTAAPATLDSATDFLLEGRATVNAVAAPPSEAAVIEEAAILFANNQPEMVEQMLCDAIAQDNLGNATMTAWWMLFDLHQITGKQQEFESLSIAYASKFETSPPTWRMLGQADAPQAQTTSSGATPMVPFTGKLDAGCVKLFERVQRLAESHRALRLEFIRITEVEPAGCGLLLGALKRLEKSGHDLILAGAPELADKIRNIVQAGRRDDSEDAWLLLMEILRLLNREQDFEEVSIDYCITFEVSPPAFVAPRGKVTTSAAAQPQAVGASDTFVMPPVIEGNVDQLIVALAAYSDSREAAIIDCSRLTRVDFNAAGRLLSGMAPSCHQGKLMEFHQVNHLVAALFNVMGLKDVVRVIPVKH